MGCFSSAAEEFRFHFTTSVRTVYNSTQIRINMQMSWYHQSPVVTNHFESLSDWLQSWILYRYFGKNNQCQMAGYDYFECYVVSLQCCICSIIFKALDMIHSDRNLCLILNPLIALIYPYSFRLETFIASVGKWMKFDHQQSQLLTNTIKTK